MPKHPRSCLAAITEQAIPASPQEFTRPFHDDLRVHHEQSDLARSSQSEPIFIDRTHSIELQKILVLSNERVMAQFKYKDAERTVSLLLKREIDHEVGFIFKGRSLFVRNEKKRIASLIDIGAVRSGEQGDRYVAYDAQIEKDDKPIGIIQFTINQDKHMVTLNYVKVEPVYQGEGYAILAEALMKIVLVQEGAEGWPIRAQIIDGSEEGNASAAVFRKVFAYEGSVPVPRGAYRWHSGHIDAEPLLHSSVSESQTQTQTQTYSLSYEDKSLRNGMARHFQAFNKIWGRIWDERNRLWMPRDIGTYYEQLSGGELKLVGPEAREKMAHHFVDSPGPLMIDVMEVRAMEVSETKGREVVLASRIFLHCNTCLIHGLDQNGASKLFLWHYRTEKGVPSVPPEENARRLRAAVKAHIAGWRQAEVVLIPREDVTLYPRPDILQFEWGAETVFILPHAPGMAVDVTATFEGFSAYLYPHVDGSRGKSPEFREGPTANDPQLHAWSWGTFPTERMVLSSRHVPPGQFQSLLLDGADQIKREWLQNSELGNVFTDVVMKNSAEEKLSLFLVSAIGKLPVRIESWIPGIITTLNGTKWPDKELRTAAAPELMRVLLRWLKWRGFEKIVLALLPGNSRAFLLWVYGELSRDPDHPPYKDEESRVILELSGLDDHKLSRPLEPEKIQIYLNRLDPSRRGA